MVGETLSGKNRKKCFKTVSTLSWTFSLRFMSELVHGKTILEYGCKASMSMKTGL